ncbi:MAG: GTPase HflX [Armatimonadetes bacterium]|nr:GTPase HflX [Armatimonadota bacterium]
MLIGVHFRDGEGDVEASLDELAALADTAGADIVGKVIQRRDAIHPALFIGKGKVAELSELCRAGQADLVVFDHDLAPVQIRNLERETGVRVIDRTELILDIFAHRARTRQAKLQVELAQLQYQLPRLRRLWTHLSRIEGGIGLRGPGEMQIEVDRRRARQRIGDLQASLEQIQRRKTQETLGRQEFFTVAMVGYTNVGKTALMNALTGERLFTENRLFATLDATTRSLQLPGGQTVLLTDTVGFIQNIPHHLVASFHATLEEVREADLLLHVVDASHPERRNQITSVERVLGELGCTDQPTVWVLNKCDLVDEGSLPKEQDQYEETVRTSAVKGTGLHLLKQSIEKLVHKQQVEIEIELPAAEGRVAAYIAEHGTILSREYQNAHVRLRAVLHPRHVARVKEMESELGSELEGPACS